MSEKIQAHHLARKAVLYVRQSSIHQVMHNRESASLQYAMQGRLRTLGWSEIEIVDDDLGRSAAGTVARAGFDRMVAEVCLGKVGVVAAREVSRFARNSRDWQQLIEMCRVVDTLLIDQEVVYAPRLGNDRLLLGLKGSLNEYELDLLRQRSLAARHAKARRGELIVGAPVGFVKALDRLEKDPDRRVQEAITRIYTKFEELGSVRQTMLWFLQQTLHLPARRANGDLVWKPPNYGTIYRILTNPAYGGAYAYGKTQATARYDRGGARTGTRRKAPSEWLALQPGTHEGYVDWERAQAIRRMIQDNSFRDHNRGAAKRGASLLAGLLRCRRCGQRLTVCYTGRDKDVLRYICHRGWLDAGQPRCIAFGGLAIDTAVVEEVMRVVEPGAIDAALQAAREETSRRDDVLDALRRDLEAARYAADRARRQFDAADPENRLVTAELEARWNRALEHVGDLNQRIDRHLAAVPASPPVDRETFLALADMLRAVWDDPASDASLKKRIVRTLVREIVVDLDDQTGQIVLVLHWVGGVHTERRLWRRRRGQRGSKARDVVDAVRSLARICGDDRIAGLLNRNGLRTGAGNWWTRERVASLRSKCAITNHRRDIQDAEGWINLTHAAAALGVCQKLLRIAAEHGDIAAEHPLRDGPWIFNRSALETDAARALACRARRRPHHPGGQNDDQKNLFDPTTSPSEAV